MAPGPLLLMLVVIALACTGVWAVVVTPRLRRIQGGGSGLGFVRACSNLYCRTVHRVQIEGRDHLQLLEPDRGVLLVANHTGAIDPFLLQVPLDRFIHWMMARDMMWPVLDELWDLLRIVPVDRTRTDTSALRQAMRLLRNRQVIGLFPEGRITRPPGTIRPFLNGLGLLATRAHATVLPMLIDGTPDTHSVIASILRRSKTRIRILEPMRFDRTTPPDVAAEAIRAAMATASNWVLLDEPMPLETGSEAMPD